MSVPLILRIVSASISVSNRAGRIIRDILKKGELGIIEKGKNDLQTEADRSAQRCIVASLHKLFPNVAIFGEEDPWNSPSGHKHLSQLSQFSSGFSKSHFMHLDPTEKIDPDFLETAFCDEVLNYKCPTFLTDAKDEEVVIWVDPLDGTSEYTQGLLDHVTVLIGIAFKGRAVGGVIYQPYYNYKAEADSVIGRCIWGVVGLGSFGFKEQKPPNGENIIATTRSHSDRSVTESVEACQPSRVVRVGGAGHKVLLLIEGKAHAYVFASKGTKKWDTCAPEAVLNAIGGTLTDLHGNIIHYSADVQRRNNGGVLATVANHNWYTGQIPEHVKETLTADPIPDYIKKLDKPLDIPEFITSSDSGPPLDAQNSQSEQWFVTKDLKEMFAQNSTDSDVSPKATVSDEPKSNTKL